MENERFEAGKPGQEKEGDTEVINLTDERNHRLQRQLAHRRFNQSPQHADMAAETYINDIRKRIDNLRAAVKKRFVSIEIWYPADETEARPHEAMDWFVALNNQTADITKVPKYTWRIEPIVDERGKNDLTDMKVKITGHTGWFGHNRIVMELSLKDPGALAEAVKRLA